MTLLEVRPCRTRQAYCAEEFQREAVRPIRICQRKEIAAPRRPCVVHDNVDGAMRFKCGVHQGRGSVRQPKICGECRSRAAGEFYFSDYVGESRRIAGGEHKSSAFLRKSKRDGSADSSATARYDDRLVCKGSAVSRRRLSWLANRHKCCLPLDSFLCSPSWNQSGGMQCKSQSRNCNASKIGKSACPTRHDRVF